MKTFAKIMLGVCLVEIILAVYKVPIANSNLLFAAAAASGLAVAVIWLFAATLKYSAINNRHYRELAERSLELAEKSQAGAYEFADRQAAQAAGLSHHALEVAEACGVAPQVAAALDNYLRQGVRLFDNGNGELVLAIPGREDVPVDEIEGMTPEAIDYLAQAQLPLLQAENKR